MACPDSNLFARFADGDLAGPAREAVELHIAGCDSCFALISDLGRLRTTTTAPASPLFDIARGDNDRFETLGLLGAGGMGVVVDARDRALGRAVAVKRLRSPLADAGARFEREAKIMASLEHPNIVAIHDVGRDPDGTPYYVMRKIEGRSLADVLHGAALTARLALLPSFLAICDAAAYAHSRGVVHRDIKPTNVVIAPFGETLLVDWGLAFTLADTDDRASTAGDPSGAIGALVSKAGWVCGTPGFMAPEQARGERVDTRADVYALGATLFYMLSGEPAFAATEGVERAAADHEPPWSRIPAEVPLDLRAIVVKAMQARPAGRYDDARALAADVRRFVDGQLVAAYRYGWRERLRRFARRHRAAVVVAAVAIAIGAVGATLSAQRIISERDVAEARRRDADDKSEQLRVAHASQLVASDPAAAIAVLRGLPATTSRWSTVALIAADAALHGIPWGVSTSSPSTVLVVSPDSRRALLLVGDRGELVVVDLQTRARRLLGAYDIIGGVGWLDAHRVVLGTRAALLAIDVDTMATTSVAPLATDTVMAAFGRAWVVSRDRELRALDLATLALGPVVAHDVTRVTALAADRLVLSRGGGTDLWMPTQSWTLRGSDGAAALPDSIATTGEPRVVARTATEVCVWNVAAEPRIEMCRPASEVADVRPFAAIEGGFLALQGSRMVRVSATQIAFEGDGMFRLAEATAHGFTASRDDGSIVVRDSRGRYGIGKQPARYKRTVITPDEARVLAVTTTGELLVWEVASVRPQQLTIPAIENVCGVDADWVYTSSPASPVMRYRRRDGAREQIDELALSSATVSGDWVHGTQLDHREVAIDVPSKMHYVAHAGELLAILTTGTLLAAQPDGTIAELPRDGAPVVRARLGGRPTAFGANDVYAVVAIDGGRICRVTLAASRFTCASLATTPTVVGVDRDGVVWAVSTSTLWRWDDGALPTAITPPQRVIGIVGLDDGLIAIASSAIARLDDPAPRFMPTVPFARVIGAHANRLIVATPTEGIALIDATTGAGVELALPPVANGSLAVSDGTSIAAVMTSPDANRAIEVAAWTLDFPHDVSAFQGWLDRVTNATPIANSDLLAWPAAP